MCSKLRGLGDHLAARNIEDDLCKGDEWLELLHRAYIVIDVDRSGEVSIAEIQAKWDQVAQHVGLPRSKIDKVRKMFNPEEQGRYLRWKAKEAERSWEAADADGSGEMSFLEFVSLVEGVVKEPLPTLYKALKNNEKKLATFEVDRMGGLYMGGLWKELQTLKPVPMLSFEDASAAFCRCAERMDYRAEVCSLFGECFGDDAAKPTVEEVWKHVPTIMMRLRRPKTSMGRAHRLLVAYGRKEQLIDRKTFVLFMERLRPYHRRRTQLRDLYEFLDFESYNSSSPDELRAMGKKDGIVSLNDIQLHIQAVAREMEFVDVTRMEQEWLFETMRKEYGSNVNWDCFNMLIVRWGDFRDTSDTLRGVFQALDTSEFGVTKQFPRVPLEEVFEALEDIMLELGLPQPTEETLEALSEFVMMEEEHHQGGIWESYLIKENDGLLEAETFHRAFDKWRTQVLYQGKIEEAWHMLDQKGGYEAADHLVTVADVIDSFELVGEIFGVVIRPGMSDDFLRGFPYLDTDAEIPRDEFESLARNWLSAHSFRRRADPLVLWRLYEDLTTDDRELEPEAEIKRVCFGAEGRALGLGECGVDEVFLLCEILEEQRATIMGNDGRASLDEFVAVLEDWKVKRFEARDMCKYDQAM